ncbi:hypothetical protein H1V43_32485 [Streptomyces sp. PSKA54]|uniref:Uncharacterized protein n=1 Tax=Streptomyces himalayensis subsp. aureolus TaxID=2758039 RepID=A0A7W2HJC6_9ACTN|nr:hypothetical protein [Streptomyces himalayensis subsp. aureolus]
MCIRVQYAPLDSLVPWDDSRGVITVPEDLTGPHVLRAVRAVLTKLAIPQREFGAVCWCGEPVRLLSHVAQQQKSGGQVRMINHGA